MKYDWCSYSRNWNRIESCRQTPSDADELEQLACRQTATIDAALSRSWAPCCDQQPRDIVFSLCQYGMADVWKWGGVGGNCWRTTGDITDTWRSMSAHRLRQIRPEPYAGPGNWNDPDMLIVGQVGWGRICIPRA